MRTILEEKKSKAGGAGRGQGRKKGSKAPKTFEKEKMLERIRQRVYAMSDSLVNAQSVVALGYYNLVEPYIGEDGLPHTRIIRDPMRTEELLNYGVQGKDYILVVGSEPDSKAVSELLNRAYGKPTESVEHSGRDGKPLIIRLDQ